MLLPGPYHWPCDLVCVSEAGAAGPSTVQTMKSAYAGVESMLLCRGEELFPFSCFDVRPDWDRLLECWEVIIKSYDRVMRPDEILLLYDGDLGR